MPEGHTIHNAARDHRKLFVGHKVDASSPQGRFSDGAKLINGKECIAVEAYGKHLLYKFKSHQFLHIHLGLFGRIKRQKLPVHEAKGSVRLRLVGKTHFIDVHGPTICEVIDKKAESKIIDRIGPDLLRKDSDPKKFFKRVTKSKAKISTLLMDQSVIAGIGNIYRTELLWRQGIHPNVIGRDLTIDQLEDLWDDAKVLLELGAKRNKIITNFDIGTGKLRDNLNIYKKKQCPKCQGVIFQVEISGRKVFFCDFCQS